jgi:hypothetical protein
VQIYAIRFVRFVFKSLRLVLQDFAFEMAAKYNLSVLLDLHGVPGSQNGLDHSGCSVAASWLTEVGPISNASSPLWNGTYSFADDWGLREGPLSRFRNVLLTLRAIHAMALRYGQHRSLLGIELVNEPSREYSDNMHDVILEYYKVSYRLVKQRTDIGGQYTVYGSAKVLNSVFVCCVLELYDPFVRSALWFSTNCTIIITLDGVMRL